MESYRVRFDAIVTEVQITGLGNSPARSNDIIIMTEAYINVIH